MFRVSLKFLSSGEWKTLYENEALALWNIRQWFSLLSRFTRYNLEGDYCNLIIENIKKI